MQQELRSQALLLLSIKDPRAKCLAVADLREQYLSGDIRLNEKTVLSDEGVDIPGQIGRAHV